MHTCRSCPWRCLRPLWPATTLLAAMHLAGAPVVSDSRKALLPKQAMGRNSRWLMMRIERA